MNIRLNGFPEEGKHLKKTSNIPSIQLNANWANKQHSLRCSGPIYHLHYISRHFTHYLFYLVDLFFGMSQQLWEVRKGVIIQNGLGLVVCARDNIAHGSQSGRLHFHFAMGKQGHQLGYHARVDNHLNLFISSVGQITQGPNSIDQDLERKREQD